MNTIHTPVGQTENKDTSAAFAAVGTDSTPFTEGGAVIRTGPHSKDDFTKREMFAILALQGLARCSTVRGTSSEIGRWAVEYADSLIHALNNPAEPKKA